MHPADSDLGKIFNDFSTKVKQRTEGRLTITVYPGATLMPVTDEIKALLAGQIEIINTSTGYSTTILPESKIPCLPMLGTSLEKCVAVINACRPIMAREWDKKGLIIGWQTSNLGRFFTASKPVKNLEDLRGMKIRAADAIAVAMFKALGASPVQIPGSDVYMALEKKTVDGAQTSIPYALSANLFDVLKYVVWDGLLSAGELGFVSKEAFNTLSAKDQKLLMEQTIETEKMINAYIARSEKEARETVEAKGLKVTQLSNEELKRWIGACVPIWDDIVATAGPAGPELLAAAKKAAGISK
jgi:TRAP-type C4-dicarboxylate transport system substrate-binding protein